MTRAAWGGGAGRCLAGALLLARFGLPVAQAAPLDERLLARTYEAGLAFAAPRTLDPVTPGTLARWGLESLNALDPALMTGDEGGELRLSAQGRVLLERPAPDGGDAAGWGRLAAAIEGVAASESAPVRETGQAALVQAFFDAAFSHLDPYSRYEPPLPAESERDKLSIDATAGLKVVRTAHGLAVSDLVPDGPAAASGLRIGDRLLRIDGHTTRGLSPAHALILLSGAEGTEIPLRVRGLDGVVRNVSLTLSYVPPESVFPSFDGEIALIRVSAFVANTAERMSQAIEAAIAGPRTPAAFVIDLRGNRGGLLREAVTSVALFAEQGVIARTEGRDPEARHEWRIDGGGDLTHGAPVIVLVDGLSASASEIMAAALADLGRAVVVGSETLGKGLVQTLARLPDGGELFVTWSRVLAPRGWPIQGLGVMPQLCTSEGGEVMQHQLESLDAGVAPMAQAVAAARAARAGLPVSRIVALRAPCPAAEGSDLDLEAARFLATHPEAYAAALLK